MVLETVAILFRSLRDESTTIYASSKLNRVGRRAARYDSGLTAHKYNRPAHKRPAPHRIAREQIACSRSRCGNLSTLPPMNPLCPATNEPPTLLHNHARYNNLGQLTQLQKIVGTQTFTIGYAYNLANELTQITYPSGRVVQQSVDPIGRLCEIAPSTTGCGTAASPYVTGYSYNTASLVIGLKYGNGIFGSFGFSPDRLQLTCLDYSTTNRNGNCAHDSTSKFGLTYSYGAAGSNNGQISSISDYVEPGRSITYTYDALYRMTNAATTGSASFPAWGLGESYDRYGNRLSQAISSGCTGITCPTNSVTISASNNNQLASPYTYDPSGNMTNDGNNTMTYDAEGHAVTASGGLGSGTYAYDGNGLRVKKVVGSTTTVYIFSGAKVIAEYQNGAGPSSPKYEYVYAGGALLARIDSSGTFYYHQDHLSNRMETNSSGGVVGQMGHFPFGESWYNGPGTKWFFTTYERDAESGNDYAMARYHISRLGRLSSPDPIAGSTANPQSLNRYSYSINDPANVTDPSGALVGCPNTVEAQPKNNSQQTSAKGGGGPSDNSEADEDDADADLQSGCGSHVNPFGGSGDAGSDWNAAFGVGGSGLFDGGFVSDDSGVAPQTFVPGEGAPGVYFSTEYFYKLLPRREPNEPDRWDEEEATLIIFDFGSPPDNGQAPLSAKDESRYEKLRSKALMDILNQKCISFLTSKGIDPAAFGLALLTQHAYNGSQSSITAMAAGIGFPSGSPFETVSAGFSEPGVRAAASTFNDDVYFHQGGFLSGLFGNGYIQESTIEHEGLHNFLHIGDEELQAKLGVLPNSGDTTNIDQALKDNDCTH